MKKTQKHCYGKSIFEPEYVGKKVDFQSLMLCVTRRCNLACEHCLRGNAQNKDMSIDIIDKIAPQISRIGCVVFSGGEPTLNIPLINYFLEKVKAHSIELGSFYIVTNGVTESRELISTMLDLYAYCDDKEGCGFRTSDDRYHYPDEDPPEHPMYSALKFFHETDEPYEYPYDNTIDEGRAHDNGVGSRKITKEKPEVETDDELECLYVRSDCYIGVNGDVSSNCDISYNHEKKYAIGNINKKSIFDIYKPYLPVME